LSCPRTIMRAKPLLLNHPNSLDTPHGWFWMVRLMIHELLVLHCSLVWVLRSVENTAGRIHIFESELRCPTTIMTSKPLHLNHPYSLDTSHGWFWMIKIGIHEL
jgi:hypothetical protein